MPRPRFIIFLRELFFILAGVFDLDGGDSNDDKYNNDDDVDINIKTKNKNKNNSKYKKVFRRL